MKFPRKTAKEQGHTAKAKEKIAPKKLEARATPTRTKKLAAKKTAPKSSEEAALSEQFYFPVAQELKQTARDLAKNLHDYIYQLSKAAMPENQGVNDNAVLVNCENAQMADELEHRSTDYLDTLFGKREKLKNNYGRNFVLLPVELCIPTHFYTLVCDLGSTRLDSHGIPADNFARIKSFVGVFHGIRIIRIDFLNNPVISSVININELSDRLFRLLQKIAETAQIEKPIPRVTVTISKTGNNWSFQVDGKPINATQNAARALVTLAIIGDREFHLLEFDKIFRGYSTNDHVIPPAVPGHAFDNKVSSIREDLIFAKPSNKNHYRKLINVDFEINSVTPEDLRNFLSSKKKKTP